MSPHGVIPCLLLLVVVCLARPADAEGLRIRVRGTGRLTAHASRDQGDLILSGSLADDAGQPLAGESVVIHVTPESDVRDPRVAEGVRRARGCDRATDRPPLAYGVRTQGAPESPDVVTVTDESGRFCFRARLPPDRHRAHLLWKGSTLIDSSAIDLGFDLSRQAVMLRFEPEPRIVSLDEPKLRIDATALVEGDGAASFAQGLALVLTTERGELGAAVTDASGRAHFAVDSQRLGTPGRGELNVSFSGNADTAFASHSAHLERHVKVTLRAPAAERRELRAQVPEDGIALDVDIGSIVGPVTDGAVEARVGDTLVGAAPVENGAAHLTLTFRSPEKEATVRLRYVPASPWFEPLGDTVLRVPIRGPNLLTKAPLLLAGLAVLAFFLLGRVSSRQQKPEPAPVKEPPNEGRPRMDVVRLAARGEWGWRGAVTDAHEEAPIAAVKLWIQRGTFDGRLVLAETTTDSQGMFAITTHFEIAGDEQLGSEGRFHAQLLQPLPPRGELAIALVSRRRALLQRMVRWAKGAGQPFDARPEPTPGHVRRAAAGDATTAQWADAMEHAAFDRGEIDADAEREIERLAPPLPAALTQTPPGKSAKLLETREPRAGDEGDGPSTGPGTTADRR